MFKDFVLLMITIPYTLFATITEIHSISEAEKYFNSSDLTTLGVFDIDDTLLIPEDPAFQKKNLRKHVEIMQQINELPLEQRDLLGCIALTYSHSQLIESESPVFIGKLQQRGVRLIALTAVMTKEFGDHYLPKMRYEELSRNGIDFSFSFPEIENGLFTELKNCNHSFPAFFSGVLCSNGDFQRQKNAMSKGEVLCAFLGKTLWMPSKIIFIDDKLYNLEEIELSIHKSYPDIEFQGLHYLGAESFISPAISREVVETKWKEVLEKINLK